MFWIVLQCPTSSISPLDLLLEFLENNIPAVSIPKGSFFEMRCSQMSIPTKPLSFDWVRLIPNSTHSTDKGGKL